MSGPRPQDILETIERQSRTLSADELRAALPGLLSAARQALAGAADQTQTADRASASDSASAVTRDSDLPRADATTDAAPATVPHIAGYDIVGRLGEGGMGVVWDAVQLGTRRRVALKLMSAAGFGSERARRRFEREVELSARLEHPHIARVYESGLHGGVYYYAMERVDGVRLDEHVRARALPHRAIVALVRAVCEAVRHAHQRGVIHRDLKPSNVMVTAAGEPRVLDFGLAKSTGDAGAADAMSVDGDVAGTPAYMSPEQAAGRPDRVDTRSDVYALGVILYHLLTGQFPHDVTGSYLDLLRRVTDVDAAPPRKIDPSIDHDLEAVILKALARDPDRRYTSAGDLAADLGHYLAGEPVSARAPTLGYLLRTRVRRHRAAVVTAAAVVLALVGTAVLAYVRVAAARDDALRSADGERAARQLSDLRTADAKVAEGSANVALGRGAAARKSLDDAVAIYDRAGAPTTPADLALLETYVRWPPPLALLRAPGAGPATQCAQFAPSAGGLTAGSIDAAGVARVWDVRAGRLLREWSPTPNDPRGRIAPTPDGTAWVVAHLGGVSVWPAPGDAAPAPSLEIRAPAPGRVINLAVSPDGRWAATAHGSSAVPNGPSDGPYNAVRLWDLKTGDPPRELGRHPKEVVSVSFAAGGRRLLSVCYGGVAHLWDVTAGTPVARASFGSGGGATNAALCADGETAYVTTANNVVLHFHLAQDRELRRIGRTDTSVPYGVALSPDEHSLLTGHLDGTVRLWRAADGVEIRAFIGHTAQVSSVEFSPDGRFGLSASADGSVQLLDLRADREVRAVRPSGRADHRVARSPDGRFVALVDLSGRLAIRDARDGFEFLAFDAPQVAFTANLGRTLAYLPDGRHVAVAGPAGAVGIWDLPGRRESRAILPPGGPVVEWLDVARDGRQVAIATADGAVRTWDLTAPADAPSRATGAGPHRPICGQFSPAGDRLVTAALDGTVTLWDPRTGAATRPPRRLTADAVRRVEFDPSGRYLLVATVVGRIELWDAATLETIRPIGRHATTVHGLGFLPPARDGRALAHSFDFGPRVWDVARGVEVARAPGSREFEPPEDVLSPAPSAAGDDPGSRVIAVGAKGTVFWDLGRAGRYRAFASHLTPPPTGAPTPDQWLDRSRYWAFRGVEDHAAACLDAAIAAGAVPPPEFATDVYLRAARWADAERHLAAGDTSSWAEFVRRRCAPGKAAAAAQEARAAYHAGRAPPPAPAMINLVAESPPAEGSPWNFAPNKPAATVHPITNGPAPDAVEIAGGGLIARDTTRFNYDAELTVACRLKPIEGQGFVIGKWYGGDSYLLGWDQGRVTFLTSFNGNGGGPTVSAPLPAGQWRHVAATFDGHKICLFIDGRLVGEQAVPTAPGEPVPRLARSPLPLGIGNMHATFRLGLAEIRLYDVALKPEDVARLAD